MMKFLTRIAVLFYVTLVMFLATFLVLFVMNWVDLKNVIDVITVLYFDETLRLIASSIACFLLLVNFLFYKLFSVNTRASKIIAFDNPSGRVSVSLDALEDMVRRAVDRMPEVKEVKSKISVSRRGLQVKIRVVLLSEVNIPEVTSKAQDMVKKKVQDIIGIEEEVKVAIYIGKILFQKGAEKKKVEKVEHEESQESNVPFQGYRA